MFSAKNLGKRLFDEDEKNEEGNQPPDKKAKITLDDNNQSDVHDAEDNFNLLAELPDEMKVNVFSYCDLGALNALARTSVSLNELITGGVKGNDAVEHNIPLFNQPLTWREMPSQFKEKATAQWEEVSNALYCLIFFRLELKINQPATNIKEFNEIENLLNEKNIERILNSIDDDVRLTREINGTHLNLSNLVITRFPLKQLLADEEVKALFLNLTNLQLCFNKLRGPIPKELGQFTKLKCLILKDNQLSGPIPKELGQLSKLNSLWLNKNQLSGSIPSELGRLSNLEILYLEGNNLSGIIPSELGQLAKLKILFLYNNELSGSIPSEFEQLSNLEMLELNNNQLSGPVPERLALRFPHLVNSEGHIARQQAIEEEPTAQRRLRS